MKRVGIIFTFLVLGVVVIHAQTNTQKVTELFKGVINFEGANINESRPISNLNLLAAQQADTMFVLNKANATKILNEAKKYQSCVISVERHTIVLIDSWDDCSQSGSWDYCMPHGVGYIQREGLEKTEDCIKNIIGTPDAQRRTVFLFNKK